MPEEKVWDNIEQSITSKPNTSFNWLWKAAAVLFFCTSLFLFLKPGLSGEEGADLLAAKENKQLNKELEQVESYYIEMISAKRSLISSFQESDDAEFIGGDFEEDLQKLDAMYEVLKTKFEDDPSKEVVDALVLNLLVRIDILNKKLAELDVDKEDEKSEVNV